MENFSKENCINALAKVVDVDADKIEQITASTSYGLYGINEPSERAKELATNLSGFSLISDTIFQVEYGFFSE